MTIYIKGTHSFCVCFECGIQQKPFRAGLVYTKIKEREITFLYVKNVHTFKLITIIVSKRREVVLCEVK